MCIKIEFSALRGPLVRAAGSVQARCRDVLSELGLGVASCEIVPDHTNVSRLALSLRTEEFSTLLSQMSSAAVACSNETGQAALQSSRTSFQECVKSAARSLGWDSGVGGHSARVGRCSSAIAKELGAEDDELAEYCWAGVFHDIGKLFVSGFVQELEAREASRELVLLFIRTHASLGGVLLECLSPLFPKAAAFAFEHQEDVDGTGYPKGLTLPELSTEGRVAHFADSYDALVTRTGWSATQVQGAFQRKYHSIGRPDDAILQAFLHVVQSCHTTWYPKRVG